MMVVIVCVRDVVVVVVVVVSVVAVILYIFFRVLIHCNYYYLICQLIHKQTTMLFSSLFR